MNKIIKGKKDAERNNHSQESKQETRGNLRTVLRQMKKKTFSFLLLLTISFRATNCMDFGNQRSVLITEKLLIGGAGK